MRIPKFRFSADLLQSLTAKSREDICLSIRQNIVWVIYCLNLWLWDFLICFSIFSLLLQKMSKMNFHLEFQHVLLILGKHVRWHWLSLGEMLLMVLHWYRTDVHRPVASGRRLPVFKYTDFRVRLLFQFPGIAMWFCASCLSSLSLVHEISRVRVPFL